MPAAKIIAPIPDALAETLKRSRRERLAQECAKLQKAEEQEATEEFLPSETPWLEY